MELKKLKKNLQVEVDAEFLYSQLAALQQDENLRQTLIALSKIEHQHGQRIFEKIKLQQPDFSYPHASWQARLQLKAGKLFGFHTIVNTLANIEQQQRAENITQKQLNKQPSDGSGGNHYHIVSNINNNPSFTLPKGVLPRFEHRHNRIDGNELRASVLGANDGLLSNMSLIMGVAGAQVSSKTMILTGVAGLMAGAISMALGEWLSVQSSRELHQHQIQEEKDELEMSPEEEKQELILLYRAKGISLKEAEQLAQERFLSQQTALDALVTEELGINQQDLGGSAWGAGIASFLLFSIGAIIPLFPYFFLDEKYGFYASIITSVCGLFIIGSATTLFTGKNMLFTGLRQILFGVAAAAITYSIGHIMGVSLSG